MKPSKKNPDLNTILTIYRKNGLFIHRRHIDNRTRKESCPMVKGNDLTSEIARVLFGLISIVMVIFVVVSLARMGTAYGVYTSTYDWAHVSLGLDHYLAVAAASILTSIILLGLPNAIWFFLYGKKRKNAIVLLAGSIALMALITHCAGKDVRFDRRTGTATKYYADTPEGRTTSASTGYDPKYGVQYKPYTPEAAAKEKGPSEESVRNDLELMAAKERIMREARISVLLESMPLSYSDRQQLESLSKTLPDNQKDLMRDDLRRLPARRGNESEFDRGVKTIINKYSDAFNRWLEEETRKGKRP